MPSLEERVWAITRLLAALPGTPFLASDMATYYGQTEEGTKRETRLHSASLLIARAFAPELFTSPPQAWLAPWEASEEMLYVGEGITDFTMPEGVFENTKESRMQEMAGAYSEMRDNHLKIGTYNPKRFAARDKWLADQKDIRDAHGGTGLDQVVRGIRDAHTKTETG